MSSSRHRRARLRGALLLPGALVLAGCISGTEDAAPRTGREASATGESRFARLAAQSFERGQYAAAARFYRESAKQRPDAAKPHLGLGRALMKLQRPRKAVEAFRSALDTGGADRRARLGLGRALTAADQPDKAVKVLQPLAEQPAAGHAAHLARGVAFDLQGKHSKAQASYRAGLESAPSNPALRNNLGLSKVLAGEVEAGIAILKEAAGRRNATTRTRQNLALAYGLAGRMDDAARIARQDLDRAGVQRNLAYYETLHALRRRDGENGGSVAAARLLQPASGGAAESATAAASAQTAGPDAGAPPPPRPRAKPPVPAPELARRADGAPIQLAAALHGSGDGAPLRVQVGTGDPSAPSGSAESSKAPDALAERIRAAEKALADTADTAADAESHWIQLASLETKDRAAQAQTHIAAEFPDLSAALPLALKPARLNRTKRVYRLRAGPFAGTDAAAALCRALRARGQGCLVVRR